MDERFAKSSLERKEQTTTKLRKNLQPRYSKPVPVYLRAFGKVRVRNPAFLGGSLLDEVLPDADVKAPIRVPHRADHAAGVVGHRDVAVLIDSDHPALALF